jgi:hypothetical protein
MARAVADSIRDGFFRLGFFRPGFFLLFLRG